ncbi:MAG TPA: CPBP family intramembrane glutamic endopeptidase [Steroidobacteraceae bacterium]
MIYLPFALLLVAVLYLWVHRNLALGMLALATAAAYYTGALEGAASVWIVLLGLTAWLHSTRSGWQRFATGVLFFGFAVALGLLMLPGFPRTVIAENVILSPGAVPYTLGLGFAKVVTGIFILAFMHPGRVRSWRELGDVLTRVAPVFLATAAAVMLLTLALGYVKFDPKWTPLFFTWAAVNLFFTCLSEEAFFRGFVQRELAQLGRNRELSAALAIAITALFFGAVHAGGGWKYALAAAVAGIGYGIAYQRTHRLEGSMAVHFGLNATHFLLFTYPALSPAS